MRHFLIAILLFLQVSTFSVSAQMNCRIPWYYFPILIPILTFDKIHDDISDSRVATVKICNRKAPFKGNNIDWINWNRGLVDEGQLLEDVTIPFNGNQITLESGTVHFFYNNLNNNSLKEFSGHGIFLTGNNDTIEAKSYIRLFPNGCLNTGYLKNARSFQIQGKGVLFSDEICLDAKGGLQAGTLVQSTFINVANDSILLPKSTFVFFNSDGKLLYAHCHAVDSIEIIHQNINYFIYMAEFYPSGALKQLCAKDPTDFTINGNHLTFDENSEINFFENGLVESGCLQGNNRYRHNNTAMSLEQVVSFYSNGLLMSAYLSKPLFVSLNSSQVELEDSRVEFYDDGNLKLLNGKGPFFTGAQMELYTESDIKLHPNGFLKEIYLPDFQSFNVQGLPRLVYGFIELDEKGNILGGILVNSDTLKIGETLFGIPSYCKFEITDKGNIISLSKAENYSEPLTLKIQNKIVTVSNITFYPNGKLQSFTPFKEITLTINGNVMLFENEIPIYFFENGLVKSGETVDIKKLKHLNRYIKIGINVSFYGNGMLKSGYSYGGTTFRIEKEKVSMCNNIGFYPDGSLLYGKIDSNCELVYQQKSIMVLANDNPCLWFTKDSNLIAIESTEERLIKLNGDAFLIPKGVYVGYSSYDTSEVSFLGMATASFKLPSYIVLPNNETTVFVKADRFEVGPENSLDASSVKAIMFSEDVVISVNGKSVNCPQMEWVELIQP